MLRRKPTAIAVTSEDLTAFEEARLRKFTRSSGNTNHATDTYPVNFDPNDELKPLPGDKARIVVAGLHAIQISLARLTRLTVGIVFRESPLFLVPYNLVTRPMSITQNLPFMLILGPLEALDEAEKYKVHLKFLSVAYLHFPVCTRSRISDLHQVVFCIYLTRERKIAIARLKQPGCAIVADGRTLEHLRP